MRRIKRVALGMSGGVDSTGTRDALLYLDTLNYALNFACNFFLIKYRWDPNKLNTLWFRSWGLVFRCSSLSGNRNTP